MGYCFGLFGDAILPKVKAAILTVLVSSFKYVIVICSVWGMVWYGLCDGMLGRRARVLEDVSGVRVLSRYVKKRRCLRFTLVIGATDVGSEAKARVLALLSYASLGQGRRRVYFIKSAHAQFVSSGKFSSFS